MLATIEIAGDPFELGLQLGRHARAAIHGEVRQLPEFRRLLPWLDHPFVAELKSVAQRHLPHYVREIEGLATGAEWHVDEAWLWNAKGDLRAAGDPPDQGCTTLFERRDDALLIAHNEDGAPAHATSGFLAHCRPARGLSFTSFAYPGLICGNSFAVNERGLVQTLNNVRGLDGRPGVPRQLVARAILDAADLDGALALLRELPRASGYHHGLAQAGDRRLLAVEAPASGVVVRNVGARHAHANHLIEADFAAIDQVVTESSRARQAQAEARFVDDEADALDVLLDGGGIKPIHCRGRAGEDSWTLATAVFLIGAEAVSLQVHCGDRSVVVGNVEIRR